MTEQTFRSASRSRIGFALTAAILLVAGGMAAISFHFINDYRRRSQMQFDPKVATVWELGVRYGTHDLTRGSLLQKWLNAHDIHALGEYRVLTSKYASDPNSVEIWFDYDSHLRRFPKLECHRVEETAFTDDLDQPYHGFLDFQDKYVGVYLPGYDHAAHRLYCKLRWMPRQPARPNPVSEPMVFVIDLPAARRTLPAAPTLPRGPITVTNQGVTATIREARLSMPKLGNFGSSQRDLTFRMKISGGQINNSNTLIYGFGSNINVFNMRMRNSVRLFNLRSPRFPLLPGGLTPTSLFTITDPYGISLIPAGEVLTPISPLQFNAPASQNPNDPSTEELVWSAPVNSAGRGTDAVRLHFDVLPSGYSRTTKPIPFDVVIPVQTDDEV